MPVAAWRIAAFVFLLAGCASPAPVVVPSPPPPPAASVEPPACLTARSLLARSLQRSDSTSRLCAVGLADRARAEATSSPGGCGPLQAEIDVARGKAEQAHLLETSQPTVMGEGRWLVEPLGGDARIWEMTGEGPRLRWALAARAVEAIVGHVAILATTPSGRELLDLETGKRRSLPKLVGWRATAGALLLFDDVAVRQLGDGVDDVAHVDGPADPAATPEPVVREREHLLVGGGIVGDLATGRVLLRGDIVADDASHVLACTADSVVDLDLATRAARRLPIGPLRGLCGARAAHVGVDGRWVAWFEVGDGATAVRVLDPATGRVEEIADRAHPLMAVQLAATSVEGDPDRFCMFTAGKASASTSCDWVVRSGRPVPSKARGAASRARPAAGREVLIDVASADGARVAELTYRPIGDRTSGSDLRLVVRAAATGAVEREVRLSMPDGAVVTGPTGPAFFPEILTPTQVLVRADGSIRGVGTVVVDLATGTVTAVPGGAVSSAGGPLLVVEGGTIFDVQSGVQSRLTPTEGAFRAARRVDCE